MKKLYRFFTFVLIIAILEGTMMAFIAPAPITAQAASIAPSGGASSPTGTPTPDPNAMPSYEFTPGDITTTVCEINDKGELEISGGLRNTADASKDYALGVQLGYDVYRGAQYVKSVKIEPSYFERINARAEVAFKVTIVTTDSFLKAPSGDEIKIRVFVASAINRPDHLFGRLTITVTPDCKPTETVTPTTTEPPCVKGYGPCPTSTETPTPTGTTTITPTVTETPTPTDTTTVTPTETETTTITPTETETTTITPTETETTTITPTETETTTITPTETETTTITPTETETTTITPTETTTITPTETETTTITPTETETPTITPTDTSTVTPTPTATATVTPTVTPTTTETLLPPPEYYCLPPATDVLYTNGFNGEATDSLGWSRFSTDTAPAGQHFLGQYGNEKVTLRLACLPEHTWLHLEFDLYIIRSWDGIDPITGPDKWQMRIDGKQTIYTTFTNINGYKQSYPGTYQKDVYEYQTTAIGRQSLGYIFYGAHMDSIYHVTINVPHTLPEVTIDFTGMGLQPLEDESWGLDNFLANTWTQNYKFYVEMVQNPTSAEGGVASSAGSGGFINRRER